CNVQVSGVKDTAAAPNIINAGSQQSLSLTWMPLSTRFYRNNPETPAPSSRNTGILISEIMYRPAPRSDGRNLRFIELFNSNPWSENLTGCRISGDVNFSFPAGTAIAAGAYLVIAASPEDMTAVYALANVFGPWTGDLNSPDLSLRLRNRNDAVLLEVPASSDAPWPAAPGGFGPSLVLSRPSLGESDPAAWSASRQAGGSPGAAEPASNYDLLDAVMINEAGVSPGFVELFNLSSAPVDVSGCELTDGTHSFVIPAGTGIAATGEVSFPEAVLGFAPAPAGGVLILRSPGGTRVLHELRYTGIPAGLSFGSIRDGAPLPFLLSSPTPGAPNTGRRQPAVVLNEIQYHPASGLNAEEYVELKNVSGAAADLSGWRLRGGADFDFPAGTVLGAGAYLVIAGDRTHLLSVHPGLSPSLTIGDFSGNLSNSGGRISLRSPMAGGGYATEDEVTYSTGGRWGAWADGGGSSLERVDPRMDGRRAAAWADSDETAKSPWTTVEVTGVLDNGRDAATALEILLDDAGECLVDDVEVTVSGGANRVPNSSFNSGISGWVFQGTHEGASWAPGLGSNGSGALRLKTSGSGDPSNRAFVLLSAAPGSGQTATLRAKVRWLCGSPGLRLRLRGNWLEAAGPILSTADLGTPGTANSRTVPNSGPAVFDVKHWPVLPVAGESVTVTARAEDPDAIASLQLYYRLDPSGTVISVPMTWRHAGLFSATIPGQTGGTLAAFFIEASDAAAPAGVSRFPSDAPAREALVRWGDTNVAGPLPTLNMWMTKATFDRWSSRSKMSNAPLDITVTQRNDRVIYNAGGQFAGSPFHTLGFNGSPGVYDTPTGHWCDYDLVFPADDRLLGVADTKLSWPGNVGEDSTAIREHVAGWTAEQMGIPIGPRRYLHLFVNGVRRAGIFEEAVQVGKEMIHSYLPGQDDGTLHKLQLWFEFDDSVSSFTHSDARMGNWLTAGNVRKTARYRANWPRRSAGLEVNDFTDLFALMDAASTTATGDAYTAAIEQAIDVEQWMRVVAFEHIIQNVDSFGNSSYSQNMYAYKPPGARWVLIPWDTDFAFNGDTSGGLFAINDSLLLKMANNPAFRRYLWRAYYDAVNGPLLAANFDAFVDKLSAGITASNGTVTSPAGVKSNAAARRSYILSQLSTVAAAFTATCPATSPNVTVTVTGTAPVEAATLEINGLPLMPRWTSQTAWNASFVLHSGANTLTVKARNSAGTVIGTTTLNCTFTGVMQWPVLRINEW
ncbi:MAG TPA: lamin tail domain-containing protein, partial [Verrucomicrobiales bacterium]|nr:lamin tail domain-containing protein [Verrucomicrobiales bacterium]